MSVGKVLFNPICIYPYANRVSTPCALIDVPTNRHSRPVLKGLSTPSERQVRSWWWLFGEELFLWCGSEVRPIGTRPARLDQFHLARLAGQTFVLRASLVQRDRC